MFSPEEQKRICGTLTIRNTSGGSLILSSYGDYLMEDGASIDLLSALAPSEVSMKDYATALRCVGYASIGVMPSHTDFELAQKLQSGDLEIIEDKKPDRGLLIRRLKKT